MRFLTREQARVWCEARSIHVSPSRFLSYGTESPKCLILSVPSKASRAIAMAGSLFPTWVPDEFRGALLWLREWGIWDEHTETTGLTALEQLRKAAGEERSLGDAPGELFDANELWKMHAHFVQPLCFGWDAFLIPDQADYFVFLSHDEIICVVARTSTTLNSLKERLHDWDAKDDRSWYPGVLALHGSRK